MSLTLRYRRKSDRAENPVQSRTRMRGADLRGSTIATLTGATCLAGTTLDDTQVHQLTEALFNDLQIQVKS